ncbi:MAG: hypothetical protein LIO44_06370 [Eubacterium sp.]|nr:hypothetical protein [Eubacterium sp.]
MLEDNTDEGFDGNEITFVWYSLRGRNEGTFKIKNSRLIIKGGKEDLDSTNCGSVLLRRQESFDFTAEAEGEIYPAEGGSGGLTCYYDENSFFTFGIKKEDGKTYVEVLEKIGCDKKLSHREEITGTGFKFKIVTEGLKRSLYINGSLVCILEDTSYLSDEEVELPKRFTGAMVGMYCTGEGSKAEFDRFEIK